MSREVDQRVVELQFNNANFEKNTKKTIGLIDYKPQKSRMDGLSGKNFSGGSVFPDNKAFRKLRFARCLKKMAAFFGFTV